MDNSRQITRIEIEGDDKSTFLMLIAPTQNHLLLNMLIANIAHALIELLDEDDDKIITLKIHCNGVDSELDIFNYVPKGEMFDYVTRKIKDFINQLK